MEKLKLCHLSHNPVVNATQPRLSMSGKLCAQLLPDGTGTSPTGGGHCSHTAAQPCPEQSACPGRPRCHRLGRSLRRWQNQRRQPGEGSWLRHALSKDSQKEEISHWEVDAGAASFPCEATKQAPALPGHLLSTCSCVWLGVQTLTHNRRSPEALGCLPIQEAEIKRQGLEGRGCGKGGTVGLHIQLIRQKSHTKRPSRLEANCPLLWKGGPCPLSRISPWGTSRQCTLMPRSSDREARPELSFHSAPVLPEHTQSHQTWTPPSESTSITGR